MAFLAPLFLAGMLAAAIPIAIHLFHRRTDPVVEFAAVRYLRRAPVEQSRRRRLREWILLALRAAALLLLALGFARPYFGAASATGQTVTLVLVDTSASLSAPGQFDRVRAAAQEAVRRAPPTDLVGVAAFGGTVDLIAPPAPDRAAAHAALAQLEPGAGATRYRQALARGAELLDGRPGRLVVVSDLQESGWDGGESRGVPRDVDVVVEDVGAPSANLAIASLRVDGADAIAVVQNFSSDEVKEQVAFTLDGTPAAAVLVTVPPQGVAEARASLPAPGITRVPRALTATVTDRSGYTADNARFAVLDPDASPSVLAITATGDPAEAFFLERALSVSGSGRGFRFTGRSGLAFADMTAEALQEFDVVAILATRGIDAAARARLAEYVRSGGGLLVAIGPDVEAAPGERERRPSPDDTPLGDVLQTTWSERDEVTLALAADDDRHPVVRPFGGSATLGNVTFRRAVMVSPPPGAAVVARYSDGSAALVEEHVGAGRVLVFASDLNDRWNDFPIQPVFVPFVHEMLRYLAAPRTLRSDYLVGDVTSVRARTPGVVTHGGRQIAINVDPRESNPARMDVDAFLAGVSRMNETAARRAASDARDREGGQRLWQAALLLMVVSLAAEGLLGRRGATA
jgi:hypothetical protein